MKMSVNEVGQSLADGMRNVTEDIIASHDVRVKTLGSLVADARKMISNNAADRKAMSKEQAAELARYAADRKAMSADRKAMSKELKGRLRKEANNRRDSVNKMLAEMSAATRGHLRGFVKDLTATTRVLLTGYRADIRKAGDIWSEMTRTLANAGSKRAALPVIRAAQKVGTEVGTEVGTVKEAALPVIRAVQKVGTVKEAVVKIQKRKKRQKR
jgi:hypothetical protein